MPGAEKPYRIYRGGRTKGSVPLQSRPERTPARDGRGAGGRYPGPGPAKRKRRRWGWRRRIGILFVLLALLFVAWAVTSYLAFRDGVRAANKLIPDTVRAALTPDHGILTSNPTNILLLGTDFANTTARAGDHHSDSILVVRVDPHLGRITYLSIPRDLRVPIPGLGENKINAAMQTGGPVLAIKTVDALLGSQMQINHIALVDFSQFVKLVDAIGGITVNVPRAILSDRFDCPYPASGCVHWNGWRFRKGSQHMDGHQALIFSRIRVNQLDPSDNDVTGRTARQQLVLQAITVKLTSPGELVRLPFIGGSLLKPLATDLSPNQLLELGWDKFSGGRAIHCRLGGSQAFGSSDIIPSESNRLVVLEVQGKSALQPSNPSEGPLAPGCLVGAH